ncbi:MAG: hypothetical protein GOVbin630_102 [Prokaryotic dsDNA virus sp.]|nr:MAG: hypothetical protein GOVbin630_102 [Prokaryotic dsDNA virus sp.]|tara:strand:- start:3062 stop:3898 length:837 start_codon:yes stop_codon:yes gene_type:complete
MKTALCISGELRSYDMTYEELKTHIIEPLNADVFVYSWETIEGTTKRRSTANIYNDFLVDDVRHRKGRGEGAVRKSVTRLYAPRKIVLEKYSPDYQNRIDNVERPQGLRNDPNLARWCKNDLSMFYTLYKCNELKKEAEKEDGEKYDLVIKARSDIRYPDFKRMPLDAQLLEKANTLFYWPKDHNESHVVSDKFAFSNSHIMDYYCSVFTHLTEYWEEGLVVERTQQPKISEHIMWHHFHDKSSYNVKSFGEEYYDAKKASQIRRELEQKVKKPLPTP